MKIFLKSIIIILFLIISVSTHTSLYTSIKSKEISDVGDFFWVFWIYLVLSCLPITLLYFIYLKLYNLTQNRIIISILFTFILMTINTLLFYKMKYSNHDSYSLFIGIGIVWAVIAGFLLDVLMKYLFKEETTESEGL